ncbi:MAG: cytochrome c3 family protein [Candidatus Bipolaricaulia bacterium]
MNRRTVADLLLDGFIVLLLAIGVLGTLAVVFTPLLGQPVDPLAGTEPSPVWYFLPFYALDQLLPVGAGLLVVAALFLGLLAVPILDRATGRSRLVTLAVGAGVFGLLVALGASVAYGQAAQTPFQEAVRTPSQHIEPLPRKVPLAKSQCTVCHSEIKPDYKGNRHAEAGVTCVQCHGGDPTTLDEAQAHADDAGYRGTPTRQEQPLLCAGCHSDPERMKPYGIATDQFEKYLTSTHGRRWQRGNTDVAVCTDCHSSHQVLPTFDPRSPVYKLNIPSTCAQCHSDPQRMAPYDVPTDIVAKYRTSVHGRSLLQTGNDNAPSCADCHGSHGASPPGTSTVNDVCGTCHQVERQYDEASPHGEVTAENKRPTCATCHNSHDISSVDLTSPKLSQRFKTMCAECHAEGSEALNTGLKLATLVGGTQRALANAREALDRADRRGFDVEPYRSRMTEARAYLIRALPVQHSMRVSKVEDLTRRARSVAESVRSQAHGLLGAQQVRLVGLALVWGFLALGLVVALLYRRERRQR